MPYKYLLNDYSDLFEYSDTLKASSYHFKVDWDCYRLLVAEKVYALISVHNNKPIIILKGLPEENEFMRLNCKGVTYGYHMNKQHWITIDLEDNDFSIEEILNFIKQSYSLVVAKLTKKQKEQFYLT